MRITLNVENGGNNGSRVNVDPATIPMVTFEKGDQILVGYNGAYVGTLTHNGTQFEGSINATQNGNQPLYFYFVGNKQGTLEAGATSCTVNISDQTHELPVLSMAPSNEYYPSEGDAYSASLHNQCALVKFPLVAEAGSIKIGGMKNEATIDFASSSINPTGNTGHVRLYSISNTEKWAILLPQLAVPNAAVTIGNQSLSVDVPDIVANALLNSISTIGNASTVTSLSSVSSNTTLEDGAILKGALNQNYKISIADGATVTLEDVTINRTNNGCLWAGITCEGDATIILKNKQADYNLVNGGYKGYPGIYVPEGKSLTIDGTGTLIATGQENAAGIGGSSYVGSPMLQLHCGNITIKGGSIRAKCASGAAAGIGSGPSVRCGNITITGGSVRAEGASGNSGTGAGIGTGYNGICGDITIANTVTSVTAIKGSSTNAKYSIGVGAGSNSTCGTITIGGQETGFITQSPYTYQP